MQRRLTIQVQEADKEEEEEEETRIRVHKFQDLAGNFEERGADDHRSCLPKLRRSPRIMAMTRKSKQPRSPWNKETLPGIGKKIAVPFPIYSSSSPVVTSRKQGSHCRAKSPSHVPAAAPRYFQEFAEPSMEAKSLDLKPELPKIHPLDMNAATRLGGNESADQQRLRRNRIAKVSSSCVLADCKKLTRGGDEDTGELPDFPRPGGE
eukprot:751683-Hanusia_phi.AAC.5